MLLKNSKVSARDLRQYLAFLLLCGVLCIGAPLTGCDMLGINDTDEEGTEIPAPPEPPQSTDTQADVVYEEGGMFSNGQPGLYKTQVKHLPFQV